MDVGGLSGEKNHLIRKTDRRLKDITCITFKQMLTGYCTEEFVITVGFRKSVKLSNHSLLLYNYFPFEGKTVGGNEF